MMMMTVVVISILIEAVTVIRMMHLQQPRLFVWSFSNHYRFQCECEYVYMCRLRLILVLNARISRTMKMTVIVILIECGCDCDYRNCNSKLGLTAEYPATRKLIPKKIGYAATQ